MLLVAIVTELIIFTSAARRPTILLHTVVTTKLLTAIAMRPTRPTIITKMTLTFATKPPVDGGAIFAPVTSVANRALYEIFAVHAIALLTFSAIKRALAIFTKSTFTPFTIFKPTIVVFTHSAKVPQAFTACVVLTSETMTRELDPVVLILSDYVSIALLTADNVEINTTIKQGAVISTKKLNKLNAVLVIIISPSPVLAPHFWKL